MGNNSEKQHKRSKSEDPKDKEISPEFAFTGYMQEMEDQQNYKRARSQESDKARRGFLKKQKSLVTELRVNWQKPLELDTSNLDPGCCVYKSELLMKHLAKILSRVDKLEPECCLREKNDPMHRINKN